MCGFLFLLFIIGTVAWAVSGPVMSSFRQLNQWNQTYRRLGQHYAARGPAGGVIAGYWLTNPALHFDYGQTYCQLKSSRSMHFESRRQTALVMEWPDHRLKFEILNSPELATKTSKRDISAVELNQSTLKAHFQVHSNHSTSARELLSPAVEWQLEKLRRLGPDHQLRVAIQRGELVVATAGYIKQYPLLDEFLRLSLDLFDQLLLTRAEGIEFLHEGEATIVENVKCPICSQKIEQNMVSCYRCQTPHCLDCWDYNGGCATFACQETRYIRAGGQASKRKAK